MSLSWYSYGNLSDFSAFFLQNIRSEIGKFIFTIFSSNTPAIKLEQIYFVNHFKNIRKFF